MRPSLYSAINITVAYDMFIYVRNGDVYTKKIYLKEIKYAKTSFLFYYNLY